MTIRDKAKTLPTNPGCYLMKDKEGTVIYVGKAKNIRKRVSSYWRALDLKTKALVANISDIEYIVTGNEVEALITEAQLIAKHHPKYNIDLKAGQKYAFLKFTSETFPRIIIARKVTKDGKFFGPYPSGAARNAAMKAANNIFRLRTKCKPNQGRACLRYHLGLCSGSCIGVISAEEYAKLVKDASTFLKGEYTHLVREIKKKMNEAAKEENFEKAKMYRDEILALEKLEQQHVSAPKTFDQDVINYIVQDEVMTLQVFHFHRGIISGRKEYRFDLEKLHIESPAEAMSQFLRQYYSGHDVPKEIVLPQAFDDLEATASFLEKISGHVTEITIPQKGTKAKLIEMVKKNLLTQIGQSGGQLYELQQVLHLKEIPVIIDCIDISHLGGTDTVGSLVQWVNGAPAKAGYRKFIIKGVEGINDFASIEEVVTRFGNRVLEGKEKKPDLLVIDGGKGQLSSATKALKKIGLEIPLIGLAKRLEEIYISWAPYPIQLAQKSPALSLLRSLRDEAHRFAITFQRKKRKIKIV